MDGLLVNEEGKSLDLTKVTRQISLMNQELTRLKKESLNYNLHARQNAKTIKSIIAFIYRNNLMAAAGVSKNSKSRPKHLLTKSNNELINITINQEHSRQKKSTKKSRSRSNSINKRKLADLFSQKKQYASAVSGRNKDY